MNGRFTRLFLAAAAALCLLDGAARAAPSLGLQAVVQPEVRQGLVSLYDADFDKTYTAATDLIRRDPNNPYGELYVSGALWWEAAAEGVTSREAPRLALRFDSHSLAAVQMAKKLFKSPDDARRAEGYFVAGMALGLRGQWLLNNGHFMKAYFAGKKAIRYLKKCVALDPDMHDAYLGLGIFDYQAAVLPGILKFGARLLAKGNAPQGLARIQTTIDHGQFASDQARQFLLTLLILFEKDYPRALTLNDRLLATYPDSPYYRFVRAVLLNDLGRWEESYDAVKALYADLSRDPAALERKHWVTVCGLWGRDCIEARRLERASVWLTRALTHNGKEPAGWKTTLHLHRGLALDMLGRREAALRDFEKLLTLPDAGGAWGIARECRQKACGRDKVWELRLRSLPTELSAPVPGAPLPDLAIGEDDEPEGTAGEPLASSAEGAKSP